MFPYMCNYLQKFMYADMYSHAFIDTNSIVP